MNEPIAPALPPEAQVPATPAPAPVPAIPAPVPAAVPSPGPDLVSINVGGRPHLVERSLAVMLAQPQPAPQPPAAPAAPADPLSALDQLWYTNPREAARLIREDVATSLRSEYQQAETERAFWQDLYREAPALRSLPRPFVEDVIRRHSPALRGMSDADGFRRISTIAQQEVLAMTNAFGQTAPQAALPPTLADNGSAPTPQAAQPTEDQQPMTLSAIIKARRAARRRAGAAFGANPPAAE